MSEKTVKFNNIRVNKKEFVKSKEPSDLTSVNVNQIVVSDKFKHNNEGFKYYFTSNEWIHQILRKRKQKHVFFN